MGHEDYAIALIDLNFFNKCLALLQTDDFSDDFQIQFSVSRLINFVLDQEISQQYWIPILNIVSLLLSVNHDTIQLYALSMLSKLIQYGCVMKQESPIIQQLKIASLTFSDKAMLQLIDILLIFFKCNTPIYQALWDSCLKNILIYRIHHGNVYIKVKIYQFAGEILRSDSAQFINIILHQVIDDFTSCYMIKKSIIHFLSLFPYDSSHLSIPFIQNAIDFVITLFNKDDCEHNDVEINSQILHILATFGKFCTIHGYNISEMPNIECIQDIISYAHFAGEYTNIDELICIYHIEVQ